MARRPEKIEIEPVLLRQLIERATRGQSLAFSEEVAARENQIIDDAAQLLKNYERLNLAEPMYDLATAWTLEPSPGGGKQDAFWQRWVRFNEIGSAVCWVSFNLRSDSMTRAHWKSILEKALDVSLREPSEWRE